MMAGFLRYYTFSRLNIAKTNGQFLLDNPNIHLQRTNFRLKYYSNTDVYRYNKYNVVSIYKRNRFYNWKSTLKNHSSLEFPYKLCEI